jgi:hypothetical protein
MNKDGETLWLGEDGWVQERCLALEFASRSKVETARDGNQVFAPTGVTLRVEET